MKYLWGVVFALSINSMAYAERSENNEPKGVALEEIVKSYAQRSSKPIVANADISGKIQLFGITSKEVGKSLFLSILRAKGLAIYDAGDYQMIVPGHQARLHITERFREGEQYSDDQYIMDILDVENLCAASLMPIFKPLVHRYSFVEPVFESNSIVIIDKVKNIQRLKSLLQHLDSKAKKQECVKPPPRSRPVIKKDKK